MGKCNHFVGNGNVLLFGAGDRNARAGGEEPGRDGSAGEEVGLEDEVEDAVGE